MYRSQSVSGSVRSSLNATAATTPSSNSLPSVSSVVTSGSRATAFPVEDITNFPA
jgi:hypothetical protein